VVTYIAKCNGIFIFDQVLGFEIMWVELHTPGSTDRDDTVGSASRNMKVAKTLRNSNSVETN